MSRTTKDALGVLRGLQIVLKAALKENETQCKHLWSNSNVKEILETRLKSTKIYADQLQANPKQEIQGLQNFLSDTRDRICVVIEGAREMAKIQTNENLKGPLNSDSVESKSKSESSIIPITKDSGNLDISSITLEELEAILSKRHQDRIISLRVKQTENFQAKEELPVKQETKKDIVKEPKISNTKVANKDANKDIIKKNPVQNFDKDETFVKNVLSAISGEVNQDSDQKKNEELPQLSSVAKQRKVPSSRIGRMASFGQLFAGLGFGTVNQLTKGALGFGGSKNVKDALFSPENVERIVDTLCKVRGAALKIGQILSIQDSTIVSPQLVKAFERVRQAADYMPDWQVNRVLVTELGTDWRDKLAEFEEKPFAAASIGQVHRGKLKTGMNVAIKIQYPGVAESIESDIDNLVSMLKIWDVFPKGFFIDNVVKVAKRELIWEVDYKREAEYTEKFKEMVSPYPEYHVPQVIKNLTTNSVLTTELVPGVPLDKCFQIGYDHRYRIAESTLKLCLRELFEFQCMQTDPNWSNFLYDQTSRRLMLIDFGSTRFYSQEFINNYRDVIIAAANDDRNLVLDISRKMGFLTGYETKQMEEAHVEAVMILGEIFQYNGEFDFGRQNTTKRIAQLVPTMVAHRLRAPPEEIYSIHRKLSGVFLLCARLNVKMNCRPFYDEIVLKKFV